MTTLDLRSIVRSPDEQLFMQLYSLFISTHEAKWMLLREIDMAIEEMQNTAEALVLSINGVNKKSKIALLSSRLTQERQVLAIVYTRRHLLLTTLSHPSTLPPAHLQSPFYTEMSSEEKNEEGEDKEKMRQETNHLHLGKEEDNLKEANLQREESERKEEKEKRKEEVERKEEKDERKEERKEEEEERKEEEEERKEEEEERKEE
ncbi:hypothetical protein PFISCL1PPCAC_15617, partial [Pristionchus fissidentatus]